MLHSFRTRYDCLCILSVMKPQKCIFRIVIAVMIIVIYLTRKTLLFYFLAHCFATLFIFAHLELRPNFILQNPSSYVCMCKDHLGWVMCDRESSKKITFKM